MATANFKCMSDKCVCDAARCPGSEMDAVIETNLANYKIILDSLIEFDVFEKLSVF